MASAVRHIGYVYHGIAMSEHIGYQYFAMKQKALPLPAGMPSQRIAGDGSPSLFHLHMFPGACSEALHSLSSPSDSRTWTFQGQSRHAMALPKQHNV